MILNCKQVNQTKTNIYFPSIVDFCQWVNWNYYNRWQNPSNKLKNPSKTGKGQKSPISNF